MTSLNFNFVREYISLSDGRIIYAPIFKLLLIKNHIDFDFLDLCIKSNIINGEILWNDVKSMYYSYPYIFPEWKEKLELKTKMELLNDGGEIY